jgi:hypothetical protein
MSNLLKALGPNAFNKSKKVSKSERHLMGVVQLLVGNDQQVIGNYRHPDTLFKNTKRIEGYIYANLSM